ncbi:unnamed protein product [Ophioblennius macclurei]
MKFSLVAAIVALLAVAHGPEARTLMRRDVQSDIDQITKIFNDMSASLTSTTQDLVEKMKAMEVTNTAQTYYQDGKAQIQPLVDQFQAEAVKLQEQMKPLADNLSAQVQTFNYMMEKWFQEVVDQTKVLMHPQ